MGSHSDAVVRMPARQGPAGLRSRLGKPDRIWLDFTGWPLATLMQFTTTQKRFAAWSLLLLGVLLLLWLLAPVLTPFVVAAILAYALAPVVQGLQRALPRGVPQFVVVALVELLLVLVLVSVFFLLVPILAKQLPLLRAQIPPLLDHFKDAAQLVLARLGLTVHLDMANVKQLAMEHLGANLQDSLLPLLASVKLGGSVALALIGNVVLIPVALFYLLMDWQRVVDGAMQLVPPRFRAACDSFTREADAVLGQYLRGQLLVMLVLAGYYSLGLYLFGLDLALPIGVFTGLAVAVPYVGFGLGLALATLAGLLEFSLHAGSPSVWLMVTVVYGLGQLLESFVLTPRLVGERIGLHPLTVIFALLALGHLLGFVGVLMALPISAVLLVAVRRLRAAYLASDLYGERAHATDA
jgi:predicted PurR-regulated permease PerM